MIMGKQVNFYMTADDEREFLDFVRSEADACVFMSHQASEAIEFLQDLPTSETSGWFNVCLWSRGISPPPRIELTERRSRYSVNKTDSEVIEFYRSHVNPEGRLTRGRIGAQMSYFRVAAGATEATRKSEAFVKWYDRLARWIKRHSTLNAIGYYVLPGAAAFVAGGGYCAQ